MKHADIHSSEGWRWQQEQQTDLTILHTTKEKDEPNSEKCQLPFPTIIHHVWRLFSPYNLSAGVHSILTQPLSCSDFNYRRMQLHVAKPVGQNRNTTLYFICLKVKGTAPA